MSEAVKESLSALLDNEASELDIQRILKAMEQDPALASHWQRYCLIQSSLHDPIGYRVSPGFSDRIAAVVANEAVPVATHQFNWRQSLIKMALAASVTVVVFAGLQSALRNDDLRPDTTAQQPATAAPASGAQAGSDSTVLLAEAPLHEVDPSARQRLEEYINSVSITPEEPPQLQHLQDSPLFRLVNEIQEQNAQSTDN